MIAMALACEPKLLIADEPTTALDVTIQAQILDLLRTLVDERGTALILITHDLGVVAGMCERVNVMYAGTIVETGTTDQIFAEPRAPVHARAAAKRPEARRRQTLPLRPIPGQPGNMLSPPTACPFAPRCRYRARRLHCRSYRCSRSAVTARSGVLQPGAGRRMGAEPDGGHAA